MSYELHKGLFVKTITNDETAKRLQKDGWVLKKAAIPQQSPHGFVPFIRKFFHV